MRNPPQYQTLRQILSSLEIVQILPDALASLYNHIEASVLNWVFLIASEEVPVLYLNWCESLKGETAVGLSAGRSPHVLKYRLCLLLSALCSFNVTSLSSRCRFSLLHAHLSPRPSLYDIHRPRMKSGFTFFIHIVLHAGLTIDAI